MRKDLEKRLGELRKEFEAGHAQLRELEAQEARVTETILRISGAIMVLEELLAAVGDDGESEKELATDLLPAGGREAENLAAAD